jgi:hypothetical protein
MLYTRVLYFVILSPLFCAFPGGLQAQCATGAMTISGFTAGSGSGTYSDPLTGNITVNFCFTLEKFTEISTNWVHGVFIQWENLPKGAKLCEGPTGSQPTQHGNRFWVFIDSTRAKNLNLPGPGFYVDDGDYNPKNNYGDNGLGTPKATFPNLAPFCFMIKLNCGVSIPNSYVPKVTVTGDGATGAWTNSSCMGDPFRVHTSGPNGNGAIVLCGVVLPVKLISFSGESTSQGNLVKWTALADNLFSHFELEVSQQLHSGFTVLHIISGNAINTNEIKEYEFLDSNPPISALYRLKMVEKDGSFVYSKIITLKQRRGNSGKFGIYPNPSSDFIILNTDNNAHKGEFELHVLDLLGRKIKMSRFVLNNVDKNFYFDISDLYKGMYFIEVLQNNSKIETINLIKN